MNKNILVLFSVFFMFSFLSAQSVLGKWKTIDDSTGKARSIIEIYESDGKIYGKIIELINPKSNNPLCNQCKGDKKNQPIIGLIMNDDVYEDGTILNPENGKTYDCRLKFEDDEDTLQVRGYLAFFYKTQYWKRIK
ncbi:DUF2147 domain-containing protein [uncultured Winogradskyella sp.]|uniref:DUF2147 domain-containing protein n=1 Tax=uncultured Winogradskyella sp. TaxID=395353 RepID=UPI0030EC51F7